MRPAFTWPRRRDAVRLLVVDPASASSRAPGGRFAVDGLASLPRRLAPGDLLVLNDAATLPASLHGEDDEGRPLEARLMAAADLVEGDRAGANEAQGSGAPGEAIAGPPRFTAVLFGRGGWRERTEDRAPPPSPPVGAGLRFGPLRARVEARSALSARLVTLAFDGPPGAFWAGLHRHGRPVQYSHLAHELPLWAVQTVYASRPWAFEMPSAGRPLSWEILLALRRAGVELATLTHAAGLSATGDPVLDRALPLRERFEIPVATALAIGRARQRGGRVVAVGTTVTRALEGAAPGPNARIPRAGPGATSLRLGPGHVPRVVDGLLTGLHGPGESHFALLAAFAPRPLLAAAWAHAEAAGLRSHELGDVALLLPSRGRGASGWPPTDVSENGA